MTRSDVAMRVEGQSACGVAPADAPVIRLTLVGMAEPLMRLEKRLQCAASGLGLALELDIRKDLEALGIPYSQTPAVLLDGRVILSGLPRTEEIETWLRQTFHIEKQVDEPRS